ncbi:MAG: LD-carboxypeptidase [Flavobacteriales bacterium]|nr:LD-carboxypeptidase [Flavobacteriales bacterium]NCG29893.1 LD-carboxypeptidase [Bacteroidota bacterium]MBT3962779.1 LD-carboxypeptidase [Flavobacteriales bacterium]MBT4704556.1 LD-carboxypeptidase [Flavobacteriales bacterium]MBT4929538.1 LD-carboxypeptidase [Flavobacteriales bacterium]
MKRPNYLKTGDKIAIVASAKKIEDGQINGALKQIESWGLEVVLGSSIHRSDRQFAGTDEERIADLQKALDNPEIKAVIFARGGYGTARIIDQVDWNQFKKNPKWLCGFSDLTVLHSHVNRNLGIETLHSSMPIFFAEGAANKGSESLKKALFGQLEGLVWESHSLNRPGHTEAIIVGGNLAVLHSISGSNSEPEYSGKILFLEDLTEYLYHLDRTMMFMKRAGHLENLSGLVVGQFTEMMDNPIPFGKTVEEIILEAVSDYDYPVAFNAPIGHVENNQAVYSGRIGALIVSDEGARLDY